MNKRERSEHKAKALEAIAETEDKKAADKPSTMQDQAAIQKDRAACIRTMAIRVIEDAEQTGK
jgi:hypothetical protein